MRMGKGAVSCEKENVKEMGKCERNGKDMMVIIWISIMTSERYKERTDFLFNLGEETRLPIELYFLNATLFRD